MKNRHEISEDELMYRQMLMDDFKIAPSKKAVKILTSRIEEVLKKLGVDVTVDKESIAFQMEFLDIHINSMSEEVAPNAAGIYIAARIKGDVVPYACIPVAQVKGKEYTFPIIYWQDNKLDEGRPEKI